MMKLSTPSETYVIVTVLLSISSISLADDYLPLLWDVPTTTDVPPISDDDDGCFNTPNWGDEAGDGCDWYENNDVPGCPNEGYNYPGSMGVANDNCCYCKLTLQPTMSPTISKAPTTPFPTNVPVPVQNGINNNSEMPTGTWELQKINTSQNCLEDTYNWTDFFGDTCEWYVINDMPGCELYGDDYEGDMGVANDNCCYCMMEMI